MSNLWAAYVRTGKEFDAQEECEALGITCHVPRRVDMLRRGHNVRPEAVVGPLLPNYVFVEASAEQWHWLKDSKTMRTVKGIVDAEAKAVMRFVTEANAEFDKRMGEIEAAKRILADRTATKEQRKSALAAVRQYKDGELLEIIKGPLSGMLAKFQAMAEGADHPILIAELDILGQATRVRLDPLVARKAVA